MKTKELLKLFSKILELEEQNLDSLLYVTGLVLVLEKNLTAIIAGAIKKGITKELRDPDMVESFSKN